ncbi:MAG: membrane protein insertase YidC [Herpetosiphonaceae bacterium]|nr:membrane protein insertase YidC [Herpetosiphonaceae bacterium]
MWQAFVNILTSVLLWLTHLTGNLGSAIILFTIVTRIALFPLTWKQLKSSKKMQELQPMMAQLKRKYGKDQQKLTQETTKLYKEYGVNPVGGCLPLVIQLPIFIGVYRAISELALHHPELPHQFLWLSDLSKYDSLFILPVLTIILQLLSSVMAMPKIQDPSQKATSQAMLIMPVMFGIIYLKFNSGAVLYWATGAVLQTIQQFFVTGLGSLTNYLPFLPDRKGFFTPTPVSTPPEDDDSPDNGASMVVEAEPALAANFWAPLQKLQTSPAVGADEPTERAIVEAKQQNRPRKGR